MTLANRSVITKPTNGRGAPSPLIVSIPHIGDPHGKHGKRRGAAARSAEAVETGQDRLNELASGGLERLTRILDNLLSVGTLLKTPTFFDSTVKPSRDEDGGA